MIFEIYFKVKWSFDESLISIKLPLFISIVRDDGSPLILQSECSHMIIAVFVLFKAFKKKQSTILHEGSVGPVRGVVAEWLRCVPLNPGIMGLSPT